MSVDRSEAVRWLLTKGLEYECIRDLPDVHDGQFSLANLAYRRCSPTDSPAEQYLVFQKHLFDKGPCFIVSMSADLVTRVRELLRGPIDLGRFEKGMANAIGRTTRRFRGRSEDRLQKLPVGRENAIHARVLDSDFVPTIGRSLRDIRKR